MPGKKKKNKKNITKLGKSGLLHKTILIVNEHVTNTIRRLTHHRQLKMLLMMMVMAMGMMMMELFLLLFLLLLFSRSWNGFFLLKFCFLLFWSENGLNTFFGLQWLLLLLWCFFVVKVVVRLKCLGVLC